MGFRLRLWSFPCVASMKALPKRKGNQPSPSPYRLPHASLNESPSQKEGKFRDFAVLVPAGGRLNESPTEKEGKSVRSILMAPSLLASMKALPKRKGNQGELSHL